MTDDERVPGFVVLECQPLLRALTLMPQRQLDAWIDQYVLGSRLNSYSRDLAALACRQLRGTFGSSECLREAA